MSQAVAAPITGDTILAPDMSAGNIADASPSRRALLAGLMLATVAAPVSPAIAHPSIWKADRHPAVAGGEWEGPTLHSRRVDTIFWAALAHYNDVHDDWKAAYGDFPGRSMPSTEEEIWRQRFRSAEYSMLTCRIQTLPALYAKMDAIKEAPEEYLRSPDDGTTVFEAVMWDVERLIMKAYCA